MTDAEFRTRITQALNEPVTYDELTDHGVQCADDLARVYLARIDAILEEADDP